MPNIDDRQTLAVVKLKRVNNRRGEPSLPRLLQGILTDSF